jgi:hypothetical protein
MTKSNSTTIQASGATIMGNDHALENLLSAAVRAFQELNTIRARDGVPYTRQGWRSDVDEAYFSSVVDALDDAVTQLTGHSAHCHPLLYKSPTK